MNVEYTNYAEMKIGKREFSKADIEIVLKNPDKVVPGKYGRMIVQKVIRKYLLRVVFERHGNTYKVITAYYTKPERYR